MGREPYREGPPGRPDAFLVAWSRLRRRRRAQLGWLIGLGCVPVAAAWCAPRGVHVAASVLGCIVAVAILRFIHALATPFACPRCDHAFVRGLGEELAHALWPRRAKCAHCWLRVGTPAGGRVPAWPPGDVRPRSRWQRSASSLASVVLTFVAVTSGLGLGWAESGPMVLFVTVGYGAVAIVVVAKGLGRASRLAWVLPLAALFVAPVVGARSAAIRRQQALVAAARARCDALARTRVDLPRPAAAPLAAPVSPADPSGGTAAPSGPR
ncbi:MAG: hypothetical protein JOZ69_21560 [Myxococcales bacterium]|nr:hypothetical protein [Myxococcales bacterium]